jgi:hypothetical protein
LIAGVAIMVGLMAPTAGAKPPGAPRDPEVGKMIYKFNVLAVPQDDWSQDDTTCTNNGRRVFFQRDGAGDIGTIDWLLDPANHGFQITDCDGTHDTEVNIEGDQSDFVVVIRRHGPPTDDLGVRCIEVYDSDTGGDDLCVIDYVKASRGGFTKIMENVFDSEVEHVLWELDTATNFRNAEVRIYESDGVFSS